MNADGYSVMTLVGQIPEPGSGPKLNGSAPKFTGSAPSPLENLLLAHLPIAEFDLLAEHLEPMTLALGEILYEPNQQIPYAIFPTSAVVSLHYVTVDGATAEVAGVGQEGMVGIALFMGGDTVPSSAVVNTAGHAFRLDRHLFEAALGRPGQLQGLLLRYTEALIVQVSQSAVCNRYHSVEQQLSRWLLLAQDRAPGRDLMMTQELVANMLGVRRESVTEAAGKLHQSGFIRCRRGHISVINRTGLESRACECYVVLKKEVKRLFSDLHSQKRSHLC